MNGKGLAAICLLLGIATNGLAQGFAGLGTQADGFEQVVPGYQLSFPEDHAAHPGFRIEWWYLTANFENEEGQPMGLQWTLFRQAGKAQDTTTGWRNRQIWMAHAALSTPDVHRSAEKFARGGIGQAGVEASPFSAWIDDWSLVSSDGSFDQLNLRAAGDGFSYDVQLNASGPLVFHGDNGFSVKSEQGQASYYYSQPSLKLTGTVKIGETSHRVSGQAWLDREWSSQPLSGDQSGWDWVSLHLDDGVKVMGFRLRHEDGDDFHSGTWITADGQASPLRQDQLKLTPLAANTVEDRKIPTSWRLEIPERAVDVTITAINPDSYMKTLFPYWEGPVTVKGSHPGRGYLEMTGY